jgi:hypothetical protein
MFTVPGTFTEAADDIRHMHATTRSVTWRGIELTVRLPPPGDASCPRCAGNNKRAHECSLSRSGMSAALKAADKRLKAAERAEAAAKADAEPERPKRFAVSGVPPLQLIARTTLSSAATLQSSSDSTLLLLRRSFRSVRRGHASAELHFERRGQATGTRWSSACLRPHFSMATTDAATLRSACACTWQRRPSASGLMQSGARTSADKMHSYEPRTRRCVRAMQ